MQCCFSALNTKGFSSSLDSGKLPQSSHITYGGSFNEIKFSIGPKAKKSLELHIGYARAQNLNSSHDHHINDYLAIFTKGSSDGEDRDGRALNAMIVLDVSGSMGGRLTHKSNEIRLQLAKQAILMFFSKLRPTDSFGLITFNSQAKVIIPLQKVSNLSFDAISQLVKQITSGGGTTLYTGITAAKQQFQRVFNNPLHVKTGNDENRIVMLTDVEDNSIGNSKKFIDEVVELGIHTTVIGVSSDFKSEVCEQLVEVKGFNYFCATQVQDLQKYLFNNFAFTFFPSNYHTYINLKSENVQGVEVFGTPDAKKVPIYNEGKTNDFLLTHTKTSFPSELEIDMNGNVKTFGGLILIKLKLRDRTKTSFDGIVSVKYQDSRNQQFEDSYDLHFDAPVNEQFFSEESLHEALSAFFYTYEVKTLLQKYQKNKKLDFSQYINSLLKLKEICPQSKKKELEDFIQQVAKKLNKPKQEEARQYEGFTFG